MQNSISIVDVLSCDAECLAIQISSIVDRLREVLAAIQILIGIVDADRLESDAECFSRVTDLISCVD